MKLYLHLLMSDDYTVRTIAFSKKEQIWIFFKLLIAVPNAGHFSFRVFKNVIFNAVVHPITFFPVKRIQNLVFGDFDLFGRGHGSFGRALFQLEQRDVVGPPVKMVIFVRAPVLLLVAGVHHHVFHVHSFVLFGLLGGERDVVDKRLLLFFVGFDFFSSDAVWVWNFYSLATDRFFVFLNLAQSAW